MTPRFLVLAFLLVSATPGRAADPGELLAGRSKDCPGCVLAGAKLKLFDLSEADLAGAKTWDCATASAKTLLNLIGTQEVVCEQRRADQFGRVFAICKAGEVDINRELVEAGMAVALPKETTDYVASEEAAKAKGIGIWRGPFMAPADYREMLAGHPQER